MLLYLVTFILMHETIVLYYCFCYCIARDYCKSAEKSIRRPQLLIIWLLCIDLKRRLTMFRDTICHLAEPLSAIPIVATIVVLLLAAERPKAAPRRVLCWVCNGVTLVAPLL